MKEDAASFLPCVCELSLCSFHLEIIMPKPPKAISGRPTRNPLHSGPISLLFCCPFTTKVVEICQLHSIAVCVCLCCHHHFPLFHALISDSLLPMWCVCCCFLSFLLPMWCLYLHMHVLHPFS